MQGRGKNAKGKVRERRERKREREIERLREREAENGMVRSLWRLAGRERKVFTLSFCSSWRISRKPQMGKGKKQKDPFFRHLLKILQHWLIKKDCPQLLFDHYGRRRRRERLMKELLRRCFVFKSAWNKAKMWRCVSACASFRERVCVLDRERKESTMGLLSAISSPEEQLSSAVKLVQLVPRYFQEHRGLWKNRKIHSCWVRNYERWVQIEILS